MSAGDTGPRSYLVPRDSRPWPELITGPSRKAVLREVGRAVAAGELAASGPLEGWDGGGYRVAVWRIKEREVAPAWRRPALIATAGVSLLAGVAAVGWWLASAATVALGAASLPLVVGGAAVLLVAWLALRRGSSSGGECETTVTIRHRHR